MYGTAKQECTHRLRQPEQKSRGTAVQHSRYSSSTNSLLCKVVDMTILLLILEYSVYGIDLPLSAVL